MESRSLADQYQEGHFVYFLPYLPMAMWPTMPNPVAEYAEDRQREIEIVFWQTNIQLIPSLLESRGMDTSRIFGIEAKIAEDFFDFVNGIFADFRPNGPLFKLHVGVVQMIEPPLESGENRSRLVYSLGLRRLPMRVFCVDSDAAFYGLSPNKLGSHLLVSRSDPLKGNPISELVKKARDFVDEQ
ncbi:MAG: hypothetical protein KatS3mg109_0141 [Pirellulaceae bacterium]|nr:MAG: hypothetical protein KatS3mg109_0141 [Pirellulaceae bacterium]